MRYSCSVVVSRLVLAALLFLPVAAPHAQQPPPPPPKTPPLVIPQPAPAAPRPAQPARTPQPFRGQINLVRVDVYATANGTPVQDLTAADFEVFEDGAPQKIENFEHILVRPATTEAADPGSTRASLQAAADPHRRVFVVYLDIEHVDVGGSHKIQGPLIDLLTRVLGPDDLVGVMTPEMSPDAITFGRKTQVVEDGLRNNWAWGRRDTIMLDEQERKYDYCFPPVGGERSPSALASALIKRRREKMVLDSLQDLVRYMAVVREGRTSVITVSDGWVLYRPDESLTTLRVVNPSTGQTEPVPGGPPPVGVGPGGTLTTRGTTKDPYSSTQYECDKDRMSLAMIDDERYFRDIFGEANRANVSFYTIDPRGLAVFDTPIGPEPPLSLTADHASLTMRQDSLRTLAENTDGIALLNSNDLTAQVRRVADDLTSYYLIGYYSTNAKLDGKFRTIKVRAKRPGIEIRARRGYRAATAEEVAAARTATDAPVADTKAALTGALGALELSARGGRSANAPGDPRVLHRGPSTGNQIQPATVRVFPRTERLRFELDAAADASWTATLLDRTGAALRVPLVIGERTDASSGQRVLTADLTLAPLGAGDYVVQLTNTRGADHQTVLVAIRVTQ